MKTTKLFFLFLILASASNTSRAATHVIEVEDFEFDPEILNVNVGDTMVWLWDEGFHTTTSTAIPTGAASWNQSIDESHLLFMYRVTVAGSYDYQCTFHAAMGMIGHFSASGSTGLSTLTSTPFSIHNNLQGGELLISCDVQSISTISVDIYNLTAQVVKHVSLSVMPGEASLVVSIAGIPNGLYLVQVQSGEIKLTEKISIK